MKTTKIPPAKLREALQKGTAPTTDSSAPANSLTTTADSTASANSLANTVVANNTTTPNSAPAKRHSLFSRFRSRLALSLKSLF